MTHPQTQDDEALVEVMARAICVEAEQDPDAPHPEDEAGGITDGFPMYVFYLGSARAVLTALRNHEGREEK